MHGEVTAQRLIDRQIAALCAANRALEAANRTLSDQNDSLTDQVAQLDRQRARFEKQLFGPRSERRVVADPARQLCPGDIGHGGDASLAPGAEADRAVAAYSRRPRRTNDADHNGLRFDDSVPVEVTEAVPSQLKGLAPDQHETTGQKVTHRLAQRPGRDLILKDAGVLPTNPVHRRTERRRAAAH